MQPRMEKAIGLTAQKSCLFAPKLQRALKGLCEEEQQEEEPELYHAGKATMTGILELLRTF